MVKKGYYEAAKCGTDLRMNINFNKSATCNTIYIITTERLNSKLSVNVVLD